MDLDKFKYKALSLISKFTADLNSAVNTKIQEDIKEQYDTLNVIYYRLYDYYKVYRVVYSNSSRNKFKVEDMCDIEFSTHEDLVSHFENKEMSVTFINALSASYVYLTKSGVNVDGVDLRLDNGKLCDSIFYCLYSNNILNKVDLVIKDIPISIYRPNLENTDKLNKQRWSIDIISKYVDSGRIIAFLMSDSCIHYDNGIDYLNTVPKELLLDLTALSKSNHVVLTHCGDLGIQIS